MKIQMKVQVLLIVALLLILAACKISPAGEVMQKDAVKIGVILPLTGPSSDLGQYTRDSLLLALDEINSNTSYKNNYELIFEDDTYDPKVGVTAINKLINVDGVKYVIGSQGSSVTLAIAPIAEANKIILITPSSQSDDITNAGDFIFRTQINTAQEMAFFSDYLLDRLGSETLDVIAVNTAYGESIIKNLQSGFEEKGKNLGLVQKTDSKETDMRDYLLKIKERGTRNVLIATVRAQAAQIVKQAKELGLNITFYATSATIGPELIEIAGEAANGMIYPYPYDTSSNKSSMQKFREDYSARFGHMPESYSASGYDALKVLVKCIEVSPGTEAVRDCLYSTKDYHGASGILTFDENGDVEKEFTIMTVKNGTFVKYEEDKKPELEINQKPIFVNIISG